MNGCTGLAADYQGQDWKEVWLNHAAYYINLINSGLVCLLLLAEEEYTIRINQDFRDNSNLIYFSNLEVTGSVFMREAGGFLEDFCSGEKYTEFQNLSINPGLYKIFYTKSLINTKITIDLYFKKVDSFQDSKISNIFLA